MTKRTTEAIRERTRRLRLKSKEELRAWGLRLFAIHSGRQAQKAYRMRGIDAMAHARKFRWPKKDVEKTEDKPRSKQLPIG